MSQLDLFPELRPIPVAVTKTLAGLHSRRVLPVGDVYHLYASNVVELNKRSGGYRVTATRMRCGLVQPHSPTWHWPGAPADEAHRTAEPCPTCFPGVEP